MILPAGVCVVNWDMNVDPGVDLELILRYLQTLVHGRADSDGMRAPSQAVVGQDRVKDAMARLKRFRRAEFEVCAPHQCLRTRTVGSIAAAR